MKFFTIKRIVVLIVAMALLLGSIFAIRSCSAPPKYEEIEARFMELIDMSHEVNIIVFGEGLPVYEHVSDPKNSTEVIRTGEYIENADGEKKERLIYYYFTLESEAVVFAYRDSYLKDYTYAVLSEKPLTRAELEEKFPSDDTAYEGYTEIYANESKKQYCYTIPYTEKQYMYYYTDQDNAEYDYVKFESGYTEIDDIKAKIETVYASEYANSLYGSIFDGVASGDAVMTPKFIKTTASNGSMMLAQCNTYTALNVEKRVYLFDTAKINKLSSNKNLVRISIDSYLPSNPDRITTREITLVYVNDNWFLNSPTV